MRGPAYTHEEKELLKTLTKASERSLESRVKEFIDRSGSGRTPEAVYQKLRKMEGGKKTPRPSARAQQTPLEPVQPLPKAKKLEGGQAILEIRGVTIMGPEKNVLAVAKQLA